jgi:hypothetical protein
VAIGLEVTGVVELLDALEFEEQLHPAADAARPHRARIRATRLWICIAAAYLGQWCVNVLNSRDRPKD